MLSLHQVVDSLYAQIRPVLTWYGSERVELGGPVLARWFSKTANLLTNEYTDLFAPSSGASQHIVVDLPSCWQKIVWVSTATLCGWTVSVPARSDDGEVSQQIEESPGTVNDLHSPATDLPPATIYVTDRHSPAAREAQKHGADVLFHNLALYSLCWDGELPSGGIDALGALMSHNDILENDYEPLDWPKGAPRADSNEPALNAPNTILGDPHESRLVLHEANTLALYIPLTELWAAEGSTIIIDPAYYGSDEVTSIMLTELPQRDGRSSISERPTSIGKLTRPPASPA